MQYKEKDLGGSWNVWMMQVMSELTREVTCCLRTRKDLQMKWWLEAVSGAVIMK